MCDLSCVPRVNSIIIPSRKELVHIFGCVKNLGNKITCIVEENEGYTLVDNIKSEFMISTI